MFIYSFETPYMNTKSIGPHMRFFYLTAFTENKLAGLVTDMNNLKFVI